MKIFAIVIIGMLVLAFVFKIGGTEVTLENAVQVCPTLNVRCFETNSNDNYTIEVIGDNIRDKCNGNKFACYDTVNNTIYLEGLDRSIESHEVCHAICYPGSHIASSRLH